MQSLRNLRGKMSFWCADHRGSGNRSQRKLPYVWSLCENCPEKAIQFEQKAKAFHKDDWKNFLIYVEQERGEIHPVTYELVGKPERWQEKSVTKSTV